MSVDDVSDWLAQGEQLLKKARYGKALTALQRAWRATASQKQPTPARGKNKGNRR